MSLTRQTITVASNVGDGNKTTVTMPAQHVYPFIIHKSLIEWNEKQDGERTRYTKQCIVSHLYTGYLVAHCKDYKNAFEITKRIKDKPIFLMPTVETMRMHDDWHKTAVMMRELKEKYAISQ